MKPSPVQIRCFAILMIGALIIGSLKLFVIAMYLVDLCLVKDTPIPNDFFSRTLAVIMVASGTVWIGATIWEYVRWFWKTAMRPAVLEEENQRSS